MEPAAGVDVGLGSQVRPRPVAPDGRVHVQVGAGAAPGPPPVAMERIGAVARERPLVVEGHDDRQQVAHRRELAQVEVAAVEVVQVDEVRRLGREARDPPRPREVEHLAPEAVGDERSRRSRDRERAFD